MGMTDVGPIDDPKLERWQAGEQRRVLAITGLIIIVLFQSVAIGYLVVRDHVRTNTLDRIELSENLDACERILEAEFLAAISVVFDPSVDRDTARAAVRSVGTALEKVASGMDVCDVIQERG